MRDPQRVGDALLAAKQHPQFKGLTMSQVYDELEQGIGAYTEGISYRSRQNDRLRQGGNNGIGKAESSDLSINGRS